MATADMAPARPNGETLLDVQHLKMHFPIHRGFMQRVVGHVRAVDDVSFYIREGETLGLVGESGCGKTTTGRCIVRAYSPTGGSIRYRRADGQTVDLCTIEDPRELEQYYRQIRLIFQDPYSSLNPRMTLLQIVGEPLVINKI
ncbi:MAG: ATP-binding cassette domain-containing protein, partial [Christensenellaceae bacterium]